MHQPAPLSNMLRCLSLPSLLGLALCGCQQPTVDPGAKQETQAQPPHIVLIFADDMGWGDAGCYNADSRVPTPHLDALAARGMRFTDAHSASSVCTPSRYALLTGRYAWRDRLDSSVLWPWDPPLIEPARITLPEMLRAHGYDTACVGKWHLGWNWHDAQGNPVTPETGMPVYPRRLNNNQRAAMLARIDFSQPITGGPIAHGFDSYYGDDVPNFPPYAWFEQDGLTALPSENKPQQMFGHAGPMAPEWNLTAVMPTLTERAVAQIDQWAEDDSDAPFFLYMPLTAPHTPIVPAEAFQGASEAGRYGDFVHQVDATLGAVVAALESHGLRENTVIIFSSDNGSPARNGDNDSGPTGAVMTQFDHAANGPWRGLKSDIWEAGHRIPLLIDWPGLTPEGAVCEATLCLGDLYATIASRLGQPLAADQGEDSFDFSALLADPQGEAPRSTIVHHSGNGTFALRRGDWKLIVGNLGSGGFSQPNRVAPEADGPQGQLYNLAEDPAETTNLWSEHPEIVAELEAELAAIRTASGTRPGLSNP